MQSVSDALSRLHEDASWFARAHELRLMVVRTTGDLRKAALKQLQGFEYHADNFSPWVLLEDARTAEDDGWQARANRLAKDWEQRRDAFAKEGIELPRVQPSGGANSTTAKAPVTAALSSVFRPTGPQARVSPFLLTTATVIGALREPLRGLVVILAPAVVDDGKAFESELEVLLLTPALARCRWVLVLDDVGSPRRLLGALGDRALESDCTVDPAQFERDVAALVSGGDGRSGTAGPRGVVPPRRVDDPPELPREKRDAALRAAGIDPRYLDEAPKLRNLLISAALAMKQGRGPDAIRQQREARDLCARLEMHQVKAICQIALASYLSGLGLPQEAVHELEDAGRAAHAHGLAVQESQARLALGLLHALGGRLPQAVRAYVEAARTAEAAQMPLIAIEGWRLAGQLAVQANVPIQATSAFQEAIRIASNADPKVAKVSSAPEAARALAALCRKRGLATQADSLEEQARAMEQGLRENVTTGAPAPPSARA